ncbi:cation-translocating P-type ATPase [Fodinisporobacter ferrooxydans]|uniref:P-type Cu(+) transporter n=1 Tax=Fodinisporobacter ferrooxydans TaxID=2901836 RepID=A0ABY4CI38_9BACL|nr:cation-translocating P-type ATPase [Alicyclobacillaceae bacterium MYW30-H2]UOF92338.1 cation-translocating P-type ATPase [Alicyclobacillaceae bacterium MYW30-H2]
MSKLHLKVGGMHCSLCTQSVQRALVRLDGVSDAQVSLAHQEVLIDYDPGRVRIDTMTQTLYQLGYTSREPNRADVFAVEKQELNNARRTAIHVGILVALATIWMVLRFWLGHSMIFDVGQAAFAIISTLGPASFVFRNAFQSVRRGIVNQDVLAAAAAAAGLVGGALGLIWPAFPSSAFFGATTFVLAFHGVGGFASVLVHVRASQSVQKLLSLQPATATRLDPTGCEEMVPVDSLALADHVRVRPGERIPVDGKIVQGVSSVDQQLVTGEPLPVDTQPGDEVIGGSLNGNGSLIIEVTRIGEDSFLQRVANQVTEARVMKPGILRLVDRILNIYVPTVLILALIGGLLWVVASWVFEGHPLWVRAGFTVLSVLVMGYPCALGMATPLAIIRASGEAAERGILMRSGEAFQVFRLVDTIVFDKTGTLTEGKPQLASVWTLNGDEDTVLSLAASADWASEHPVAKAIVSAAKEQGLPIQSMNHFHALPGRGIEARIEDQEVLIGTERLMTERGLNDLKEAREWIAEQQWHGRTIVFVAYNGKVAGAISVSDRIKPDAKSVLASLKKLKISAILATGDHQQAASAVAEELGITDVHAQLLPEDKLSFVRQLQREGRRVAFIGDGINDAPSLMQADVGIAIGTGTDIAIDAADVVLPGQRLKAVLEAHILARTSYAMTVRNVLLALSVNGIGVVASLSGFVHPLWAMLAMAFSLVVVLGHTLFSRFALGEPQNPANLS